MRTVDVRFEHRTAGEPALGLGTGSPRLSWKCADAPDGYVQGLAEIEITRTPWGAASTTELVTLPGADQVLVPWPVAPLTSRERASVRVRVASTDGIITEWSDPAVVEAGLLDPSDWGDARFISPAEVGAFESPAPALVASLSLPAEVVSARLHVTAHGWYEVLLNGAKVGQDWFGPGWTSYASRLRYYSYDVTDLLRSGTNDVAIMLGDGWWRSPLTWDLKKCFYGDRLAALARLDVVTADGQQHLLTTDGTWQAVETNITANSLYAGENQDLGLPLVGTTRTPVQVQEDSLDRLVAAEGPAVRETGRLAAQKVWRSPSGKLLVDFGQNLVGMTRLTVRGLPAGHEVTIRHAEVLEHDELGVRPLRNAKATDTYLVAGTETEVLQPHFTFHGFRYAEVSGVDELDPTDIVALVLGSALTRTGWFECSDPLLNQLHSNVVWGMRGNFVDVPTDCPQRDERLGWTGDIQVFSPAALYLHDAAGFLSSWSQDLAADQKPDGNVPVVIPDVLSGGFMAEMVAAAWGDAAVVVPWNIYRATGDATVLRRQLASMTQWVEKVSAVAGADGLWGFQFGDWLDPDAAPDKPADAKADSDIVATACYFHVADLTSRACEVLGDHERAATYAALAETIRSSFQRRFVTPDGYVMGDAPTSYAMAITWGMLSDDQAKLAGARLADLVRLSGFRISTGFVGTPIICDALSSTGHSEVAYRLLQEKQLPSWLYPVTMGATTIWERWDSMLPDGTINPGEMTSFNHYALGAVADWMHRVIAGLAFDPVARIVTIAPTIGGTLAHASTALETPYGRAASGWRREGTTVVVDALVPPGVQGHVTLPDGTSLEVASGRHRWTVHLPVGAQRPLTIREIIGSPWWDDVVDAIVARTPLSGELAVTAGLRKMLDAPVGALGGAVTLGGMMGPADEIQQAIEEIVARG